MHDFIKKFYIFSSMQTFHTPSFGDDDFELPPLGQNVPGNNGTDQMNPGFQGGGGGNNGGGMNNPNMHYGGGDYQNMSSPNRNSPRMQMGVTSPPHHQQSPSHTISSDNFNTMANQGPVYTDGGSAQSQQQQHSSYSEPLSHMAESMPNPAVSSHQQMALNPHFPPQNLDIPPITQSNMMGNMTHQGHPIMSQAGGNNSTFHNMTQAGVTMDPYMMGQQQQQQQHPPHHNQLSTINQSQMGSHFMQQSQHHQGQMPPPQSTAGMVKQSPSPPTGTTRRSPNQESSEDSDDNTPLAQVRALF